MFCASSIKGKHKMNYEQIYIFFNMKKYFPLKIWRGERSDTKRNWGAGVPCISLRILICFLEKENGEKKIFDENRLSKISIERNFVPRSVSRELDDQLLKKKKLIKSVPVVFWWWRRRTIVISDKTTAFISLFIEGRTIIKNVV